MTELKHCPFCGGEAEYSKINTSNTVPFGTVQHFVTCKKNCLEGLYARGNTKEEAIKAWNKRPSPWHTGTPTEDGTFLVLWKDTEEQMRRFSVLHWNEYNDTWYDEESTYCNWGDEDHAEVIAWQKIEPYKEKA